MEFYQDMIQKGHSIAFDGLEIIGAAIEDADDEKGRKLYEALRGEFAVHMVPLLQHFGIMK